MHYSCYIVTLVRNLTSFALLRTSNYVRQFSMQTPLYNYRGVVMFVKLQPFVLANYRRLQMMYCDTSFSNNKAIVTHPPFPLQCVLTGNVLAIPTGLFYAQCLKITEKVSFNIASKAIYIYILSGRKFIEKIKNGQFWQVFENLKFAVKQCYQAGQF